MLRTLKNAMYFLVAGYFRFFAKIALARWNPRVVVVTGSNGKTTALHLIEAQLATIAHYSHGANSSFGIPFDILGLKRKTYSPLEWAWFGFVAPIQAWKKPSAENIYIVEADCDRPGEGIFLSSLLKPEVTVWLSSARTHSQNFDKSVRAGSFANVDEAIAYEFGYFLEHTSKLVIVNADEPLIVEQLKRAKADVFEIKEDEQLQRYELRIDGSEFVINKTTYHAPFLLPQETSYAIVASVRLAEYFDAASTSDLSGLTMPPGRSSIFKGIKNTTIIDSTYNVNAASVSVILRMVGQLPAEKKWLILGDLTEQGAEEKEEHEKIAQMLSAAHFQKIILVGPRLKRYALPILETPQQDVISFDGPREALNYLSSHLEGGEMLVFKGARFLEGVVEHLLADKNDAAKLCRREAVWQKRRTEWNV